MTTSSPIHATRENAFSQDSPQSPGSTWSFAHRTRLGAAHEHFCAKSPDASSEFGRDSHALDEKDALCSVRNARDCFVVLVRRSQSARP